MLDLTNTTILTVNCTNPLMGAYALKYSCKEIKFKEAILFTHEDLQMEGIKTIKIPKLNSVNEYNDFILRLGEHIDSDYTLIVQDDGFVVNPKLWNPKFHDFDYIGAIWPAEESWTSRQLAKNFMHGDWNRVGNGGFSLRSRKFIKQSLIFQSCDGYGEDAFLCTVNYNLMVYKGIKFAPLDLAIKFSYENNLDNWQQPHTFDPEKHFGFHGHNFTNSTELINLKMNI